MRHAGARSYGRTTKASVSEKRFMPLRKFNRAILNPISRALIAGRVPFCSLLYHIGRRSGREYAAPVTAVMKDGYIYIPLTYGPDTDWYLNVRAAGSCRVKIKGKVYSAGNPEQVDAEGAAAAFPNNSRARIKLNRFLRLTVEADS
jgi:deazaflavin-dependent oxidoreductase (nitroreductase family)